MANNIKNTTIPALINTKESTEDAKLSQESSKWTAINRKRTRSSPDHGSKSKRQTLIQDYWLPNPTKISNTFQILQNKSDTEVSNPDTVINPVKSPKSPPIFISGVENIQPLINLLNTIAENSYTLKILSNNEVKILPHSPEKYLPIIEELKNKNTQFYTYQMKQNKTYKCVLRNIHPSVDTNEIEKLGHKVVRISNIQQRETKKPLPLFFIELETNDNNKDIYKIDKLLNSIVCFEAPHKKREIPQCTRCQVYGHTKNYCNKSLCNK